MILRVETQLSSIVSTWNGELKVLFNKIVIDTCKYYWIIILKTVFIEISYTLRICSQNISFLAFAIFRSDDIPILSLTDTDGYHFYVK